MLLCTLRASLLGYLLTGKGIARAGSGIKKRKRNCKSWLCKTVAFLMVPHPLKNFEIQKYYQNEPTFKGVLPRNNLSKKTKDGAYV